MAKEIDYDALAKKFGAIEQPAQPEVDYDALAAQYGATQQPEQQPMTWPQALGSAVVSAPSSIGGMVSGIYEAVTSPVQTAKGVVDVAAGGLQNLLPESLVQFVNKIDPNVKSADEARAKADALGQFYKQRYGSEEGFKQAVATDPASVMADAASVLTGGGAAISKLPAMQKMGQAVSRAGTTIDPLRLAASGTSKAVQFAGKGMAQGLGVTTGAGAEAIKQAYQAGKEGGARAESFQENLRGNVPVSDVLDIAKQDLAKMNAAKSAEYRANMQAIKQDKTVLDFSGIDNTLNNVSNVVTYKGQIKNQAGAEVLSKISNEIENWKSLNPAEYHTPEGLDALKQVVGGIVESIPVTEKTASMVGKNVYNAIKTEISKQAPGYAEVMKNYSQASDQIKEIERALSLGNKASVDTATRKLQSIMRNNASTNYGQRLQLAQELEQQGGQIMPALAGQALSDMTPRGIQRGIAAPTTLAGYSVGGAPLAVGMLTTASPRLMGESAYYAGKAGGALTSGGGRLSDLARRLNVSPTVAANILYQAQQAGNK